MVGDTCILEGHISVEAALKYESRKVELCYVDVSKIKKRDRKKPDYLILFRVAFYILQMYKKRKVLQA